MTICGCKYNSNSLDCLHWLLNGDRCAKATKAQGARSNGAPYSGNTGLRLELLFLVHLQVASVDRAEVDGYSGRRLGFPSA